MDALDVIRKISYLEDTNDKVSVYLAQHAIRQTVKAQQMVVLEDEISQALYIVESGGLKAIKLSPTGREHVLHFIEAGETFNEMSVLSNGANTVTVIALEDCVLWKIEQAVVWNMLEQYPDIAKIIIQHLAGRFQRVLRMIEDLSFRTIEARLARYLLEQSTNNEVERARWATQAELANRLGTVPDVLHRALRTLTRENLIHVERRKITILDCDGLQIRSELDK